MGKLLNPREEEKMQQEEENLNEKREKKKPIRTNFREANLD